MLLSNSTIDHKIQSFKLVHSAPENDSCCTLDVDLTFRSTQALQLDTVVPVLQRVESGVKSETRGLMTLRGARNMGALQSTTVLPMEAIVLPLEAIVLFLENLPSPGSRPWDSFAPAKCNSLPAKGCRPVHDLVSLFVCQSTTSEWFMITSVQL